MVWFREENKIALVLIGSSVKLSFSEGKLLASSNSGIDNSFPQLLNLLP